MPLIRELQAEFAAFQPKITPALHKTYGEKGELDDLALALGLGCWLGEHLLAPLADVDPRPDANRMQTAEVMQTVM